MLTLREQTFLFNMAPKTENVVSKIYFLHNGIKKVFASLSLLICHMHESYEHIYRIFFYYLKIRMIMDNSASVDNKLLVITKLKFVHRKEQLTCE